MAQLGAEKRLDHETLWTYGRALLDRVGTAVDRDAFMDECLDLLIELFGADRGLILLGGPSGAAHALNARTHGRALDRYEREEISRTVIRKVEESGAPLLWEPPIDPSGADAGSGSMVALGIFSALAAPLYVPARGIIYLDFRDRKKQIGALHLDFLDAAARLVSIVIAQTERLGRAREDLRAATAREGDSTARPPGLEELLRPASLAQVRDELETSVQGDLPILILGESGTGKTLLARAIAEASGRLPLVRATLGHSDDLNTITSELFGHEKGSFSGALAKRIGLVEFADRGTLVLDEILNLPLQAQQLLLDFTQFGTFRPLGHPHAEPKYARVRIIAATNGDLDAAVRAGTFREDLYHRLSVVTIALPPLRDRREDIPSLAEAQLRRLGDRQPMTLSLEARRLLLSDDLPWPGNIRQLESVILRARERAVARDPATTIIEAAHLAAHDLRVPRLPVAGPSPTAATSGTEEDLAPRWEQMQHERERLDAVERALIERALARHGGIVARAARDLGLARTSLVSRLQTLKIKPEG